MRDKINRQGARTGERQEDPKQATTNRVYDQLQYVVSKIVAVVVNPVGEDRLKV